MHAAYIVAVFPKLSENFILEEVLAVQGHGVDVTVFAFAPSGESQKHPRVADVQSIRYLPWSPIISIALSHLKWLRQAPQRYLRALRIALTDLAVARKFFARLPDVDKVLATRPDHLHAHFGTTTADFALLVNALTGIPYSFTTHRADIFDNPPRNYALKSRTARKHVTVSTFNRSYLNRELGVPMETMEIVHCGIDMRRFSHAQRAARPGRLVCISRLVHAKGLDVLVEACRLLDARATEFECLIVGEGEQRQALEAQIANCGLYGKVQLMGAATHDEVVALLLSAAAMVLPSRSEGIPVALMEAMALGVPVISTRVTGIPELVEDGVSGYLVEPENAEALATRVGSLFNGTSPVDAFVEAGRKKIAEEFELGTETRKLIELWAQ